MWVRVACQRMRTCEYFSQVKLKNNQCESCKLNEDEQNKKKKQKKNRARQNSNVLTVLSDEKLNINKWKKIEEIDNAHLRSLAPIY